MMRVVSMCTRRQSVQFSCATAMCVWALALALSAALLAAARPECPPNEDCRFVGETKGDFVYELDDGNSSVSVNWRGGAYVELVCRGAAALDARAAPRFLPGATFPRARVACMPGGGGGLGAALARLGVGGVRRLTLAPPHGAALSRAHLAALPGLQELRLEAPADNDVTLAEDALADLLDLQVLTLLRVAAPTPGLQLPRGFRTLVLQRARGAVLPPRGWAGLRRLRVEGASNVTIDVIMTELRELWVSDAPLTLAPHSLSGALLENVTIQFARTLPAELFTSAEGSAEGGRLRQLVVLGGEVTSLAPRWLADMPALQVVRLSRLPLSVLPAALLHGSGNLSSLSVTHSRVTQLPPDLLRDAGQLTVLDLSYNDIEVIPESLLAPCARLQSLDVSHNRLASLAWAAVLGGDVTSLSAGDNPLGTRGEVCAGGGVSPLSALVALRELRLRNASLARVCRDWRLQLTRLALLDLSYNNITELDESLLHWVRVDGVSARAKLSHNPVSAVYYGEDDWRRANDTQPASPAQWSLSLELHEVPLECDCRVYWVLQAPPPAPRLPGLCEQARQQIQSLSCESEPCPPNCTCFYKPSEPDVTHMTCSAVSPALLEWPAPVSLRLLPAAAVAAAPRLLQGARRLLLAGNRVAALAPQDLPDYLQEIDVSNNSIEFLPEDVVTSLFNNSRLVSLAHNPLACTCAAEPLLHALHAHRQQVQDYAAAACADGRPLAALAARSLCSGAQGLLAGLGAGGALLLAAGCGAALLARYRHLLKALLHARGLWPAAEEDAEEYEYDAFVSYSHLDAEWVEGTLVPRLEAAGRRLCLHARDWRAGEWVTAQMERSVRAARRTVAVLSPRYLAARWPRAELRLALAASSRCRRPRLVLLVLEDVPQELLDDVPLLRGYLQTNTHLRADDAAFWHKLACAVPPARRAAAAEPSCAAAA